MALWFCSGNQDETRSGFRSVICLTSREFLAVLIGRSHGRTSRTRTSWNVTVKRATRTDFGIALRVRDQKQFPGAIVYGASRVGVYA